VVHQVAAVGQGRENAQAGGLGQVEGAGEFGQAEALARVGDQEVQHRDHPVGRRRLAAHHCQHLARALAWLRRRWYPIGTYFDRCHRGVREPPVLTQPFADAVAEAEKVIEGAPHIRTEQDLVEGYDYLAGSIRASLQMAWAYQRDFPFFVRSTGPYTK